MKFAVLSPLEHDGTRYDAGAVVDLEDSHSAALLAAGTIREGVDEEAPSADVVEVPPVVEVPIEVPPMNPVEAPVEVPTEAPAVTEEPVGTPAPVTPAPRKR